MPDYRPLALRILLSAWGGGLFGLGIMVLDTLIYWQFLHQFPRSTPSLLWVPVWANYASHIVIVGSILYFRLVKLDACKATL